MKASEKPTNAKKIILPPLFMSTGALMFIDPVFRVTRGELIEAVVLGLFFRCSSSKHRNLKFAAMTFI